jgi:hypothetical protein
MTSMLSAIPHPEAPVVLRADSTQELSEKMCWPTKTAQVQAGGKSQFVHLFSQSLSLSLSLSLSVIQHTIDPGALSPLTRV